MIVRCLLCGDEYDVPCTQEQYARWKSGELIQRAMPNISADQRELFISGTCGKCFDKMFPDDMDEDGFAVPA